MNGPPEAVVTQLNEPVNVPVLEPLYDTVTVPGTPGVRLSGLGAALKPAPEAVQVTEAALPDAVKVSGADDVVDGRRMVGSVTVVPDTVPGLTAAAAAGQVNDQLRVKGEPATVGVAVSVHASVAVASEAPRVQLRSIEPLVVVLLMMPLAGVIDTAPNEDAPEPEIAQPLSADWPAPAAPAEVIAILAVAVPAAPLGKVTALLGL